jgi:DNA-binding FadR family transcriptional regulator
MPAGLTSVQVTRISDEVMSQMEHLIASGEWPVGSRIPSEPELVSALGVGRNTVREAVRGLERAGLLQPRRGDGTYVIAANDLSAALYRRARRAAAGHVLDVRASLERDAAATAAANRTEADIAAINAALAARRSAWDRRDLEAFVVADVAFHQAVVAATGNPVLADVYSGLSDALRENVTAINELHDDPASFPGHEELGQAIESGDVDGARRAVDAYLRTARILVERGDR